MGKKDFTNFLAQFPALTRGVLGIKLENPGAVAESADATDLKSVDGELDVTWWNPKTRLPSRIRFKSGLQVWLDLEPLFFQHFIRRPPFFLNNNKQIRWRKKHK